MSERTPELGAAGWHEALDARDWERAYSLLQEADERNELDAAGLEDLAEAGRWTRHYEEMIEALERASESFERQGEPLEAGRVAVKLTIEYYQRNERALAGGSLQRAMELLADSGESRAAGMVLFCRTQVELEMGDASAVVATSEEMAAMAERLGDRDLEALALMARGRARQLEGGFEEGAALMDHASAGALTGGLELWTSGYVLCANITACRHRGDLGTAAEWSDAALRWCRRNSVGYFPGLCRLHKAETLELRGEYEAAVTEIEPAIDDLRAAMPRFAADGLQELGEIRRRQGELAAATELFARAVECGGGALPGLALLRLDEGKPRAALALLRDALADSSEPRLGAGRAQLLPVAVRAGAEAGELDFAREALLGLGSLAEASGTAALAAAHETAAGRLAIAEGDHAAAVDRLRQARRLWKEVGAPYDGALARAELARANLLAGDREGAEAEAEAALTMLRQIGARHAQAQVESLIAGIGATSSKRQAAMMFTDMVGSTKLVEALGDDAWESLLRWHDRTLRGCVSEAGGTEVKHEGDGIFASFDDADAAIRCACAIQRSLRSHQAEHGYAPAVRIGIHADQVNDRGGDLGGRGVHVAARVMSAAGGGEILVTGSTLEEAAAEHATGGGREIDAKGIAEGLEVFSIDWQRAG